MAKKTQPPSPPPAGQPAPGDPIYNAEQAAAVLDCNKRILEQKFRSGEIKARKRLGKWLTTHSNLLAYVVND
jgi:hypothetical protein